MSGRATMLTFAANGLTVKAIGRATEGLWDVESEDDVR